MTLVLCVDDRGGLLFAHRRQSQDRAVRADLIQQAQGQPIWMDAYTRRQFAPQEGGNLQVSEDILAQAQPEDYLFLERQPVADYLPHCHQLILYHWNRHYPSDFTLSLPLPGWCQIGQSEFPGFSHETITKEVYRHETD